MKKRWWCGSYRSNGPDTADDVVRAGKVREIAADRLRETDIDTPQETDVMYMYSTVCSIRRRFSRGLPKKYSVLLKKLRKAKKECPMHEKPEVVKTHLRNMIIMPEMIGSVVGVYSGKSYVGVEIKAEMVGTYLAEYSMTYRPIKHGRPGIGATASSKFVPLK